MENILKNKWLIRGLGGFLALFIGLGIWGTFYFSKTQVINRYVTAYQASGNTFENIKGYLVWADTKQLITTDEAKYAEFKALNSKEASALAAELKEATEADPQYLTVVGRRFGIFPNYQIAMKPLTLTLTTNVNQVDLLLNGKLVATSDSESFSTQVDHLPIAHYTASLSGSYNNKPLKLSKSYDGENPTIDLQVTFKTFTVTSNLTDGVLYFDKNRVGTLSDGTYEVSDYPVTDASKAYVKKTFSDGDLSSKSVELSSIADGSSQAFDVANLLTQEEAGQNLVKIFDQLMVYVTTGQDGSDLGTVFENGASNAFYKGLKSSVQQKLVTDKRKASSLSIPNLTLTNMTQVGKASYLLDFAATYDYYYDQATDTSKKTYGHILQELTGQVTLTKSGDRYLVSQSGDKSITANSEDNQVKADSIFPESLLGTWKGAANEITYEMTFEADGKVTLKISNTEHSANSSQHSAQVTALEEKSTGLYRYLYEAGSDTSTFVTGGIGGVGVKYDYGIKIDGDKITPVIWQASTNADFDYSRPSGGVTLTKD